MAAAQAALWALALDSRERAHDGAAQEQGGLLVVRMRPLARLRHEGIDDAEAEAVVRGQPQPRGGLVRLRNLTVEAQGRVFGRDHLVDGVLQHEHAVGYTHRDGGLGGALARDDRERR